MVWDIQEKGETDIDKEWGVPKKILKGKKTDFISSFFC